MPMAWLRLLPQESRCDLPSSTRVGTKAGALKAEHVNEKFANQDAAGDTSVYVAQLRWRTAVLADHRCNGPSMDLGELRGFAFSDLAYENNRGKLSHILP